jgi:hypothetical protein
VWFGFAHHRQFEYATDGDGADRWHIPAISEYQKRTAEPVHKIQQEYTLRCANGCNISFGDMQTDYLKVRETIGEGVDDGFSNT